MNIFLKDLERNLNELSENLNNLKEGNKEYLGMNVTDNYDDNYNDNEDDFDLDEAHNDDAELIEYKLKF